MSEDIWNYVGGFKYIFRVSSSVTKGTYFRRQVRPLINEENIETYFCFITNKCSLTKLQPNQLFVIRFKSKQ